MWEGGGEGSQAGCELISLGGVSPISANLTNQNLLSYFLQSCNYGNPNVLQNQA